MNDEWNEELHELGRRYRELEAPAYLATRIRAEVAERPARRSWIPATVALAATAVALAMLPLLIDSSEDAVAPTSMTVLSLAAASTSSMAGPSLSQVGSLSQAGSLSLPPPPSLRELRQEESNDEFDTSFEYRRKDSDEHKENDHAYG